MLYVLDDGVGEISREVVMGVGFYGVVKWFMCYCDVLNVVFD